MRSDLKVDPELLGHDLVANASHELRTPVASIVALTASLKTAIEVDPEASRRLVQRLELEAERLSRMIADLLRLSRLEAYPIEFGQVRLDLVVRSEAEQHRPRAVAAGLRLHVQTQKPVLVQGSEEDLALIVRNLLDNAIHYTASGGEIRVFVKQVQGSVRLTVKDTGVGIPESEMGRIFERFYRVDAARSRDTGGSGLGLSMVRSVVQAHSGSVTVESVIGRGSTFTIRLPAIPAPERGQRLVRPDGPVGT